MSLSLKIAHSIPLLHQLGFKEFSHRSISRVSTCFYSQKRKYFSVNKHRYRRLCSINSDGTASGLSDATNCSPKQEGSMEKSNSSQEESLSTNQMLKRLRRYGISGILSYGLLNTAYYLTTFLLVWFYVAPAPGRMGYLAAFKRFLKIMAMVWAGSQVTKLARAGGALALAPFVDGGLAWFTVKFGFESQAKAFLAIVGFCFGLAILLFFVVTLLWA